MSKPYSFEDIDGLIDQISRNARVIGQLTVHVAGPRTVNTLGSRAVIDHFGDSTTRLSISYRGGLVEVHLIRKSRQVHYTLGDEGQLRLAMQEAEDCLSRAIG